MTTNKACEAVLKDVLTKVEEEIDDELERLNDIETLRKERLRALKEEAKQQELWKANGHGTYSEIEEKQLFDVCRASANVILHFYNGCCEECKVMDYHLALLARKHIESKFIKINSEKSPFLKGRLGITIFPTLVIIKDNKTEGRIAGLAKLGNVINFNTELLEWRIAQFGAIRYVGDLNTPPEVERRSVLVAKRGSVRQRHDDNESDDEFCD
ncbi:thioredoxin domain-containing protein 9 [Rhodnius prolixus]|uniref:Thioredoxin domain-containing protein 9 n=2 Tax=Rhodnius TaxID=13248 RepID=R4G7W6_RHOPR